MAPPGNLYKKQRQDSEKERFNKQTEQKQQKGK